MKIDAQFTFTEAVDYVVANTYLGEDDAKTLLKAIYQIQLETGTGRTSFMNGQVKEVVEDARTDNSSSYYSLKISLMALSRLASSVMSTVPTLKED